MSRIFGDECFDRRYLEEEIHKAFLRGLKQGRSEGYDNGFEQGDFQGFNYGRKQGYNDGFNDGEKSGYENGYAKGYDNCKEIYDDKMQQAYENGNQNGYEKGFQAGHDKCEEEFNGSTYIWITTTVTRADASTETMAATNFKTLTANAETMTDSVTFCDSISIENETIHSIPNVYSDISSPQTPSIIATVTTDDFIPLVQESPPLCSSIDDHHLPFKGVLSAPRLSTTQSYARTSDKSSIKLSQPTTSGFFDVEPQLDSSDDFHSFASIIGTSSLKRRDPDTFRGGG
mmetsp:Transcript_55416/g.115975  ORF Transcript_55416/g.115975 Transcript_55416/m.115975 type:complete len:287 (-) Transcript_55416:1025-1885(-)